MLKFTYTLLLSENNPPSSAVLLKNVLLIYL